MFNEIVALVSGLCVCVCGNRWPTDESQCQTQSSQNIQFQFVVKFWMKRIHASRSSVCCGNWCLMKSTNLEMVRNWMKTNGREKKKKLDMKLTSHKSTDFISHLDKIALQFIARARSLFVAFVVTQTQPDGEAWSEEEKSIQSQFRFHIIIAPSVVVRESYGCRVCSVPFILLTANMQNILITHEDTKHVHNCIGWCLRCTFMSQVNWFVWPIIVTLAAVLVCLPRLQRWDEKLRTRCRRRMQMSGRGVKSEEIYQVRKKNIMRFQYICYSNGLRSGVAFHATNVQPTRTHNAGHFN